MVNRSGSSLLAKREANPRTRTGGTGTGGGGKSSSQSQAPSTPQPQVIETTQPIQTEQRRTISETRATRQSTSGVSSRSPFRSKEIEAAFKGESIRKNPFINEQVASQFGEGKPSSGVFRSPEIRAKFGAGRKAESDVAKGAKAALNTIFRPSVETAKELVTAPAAGTVVRRARDPIFEGIAEGQVVKRERRGEVFTEEQRIGEIEKTSSKLKAVGNLAEAGVVFAAGGAASTALLGFGKGIGISAGQAAFLGRGLIAAPFISSSFQAGRELQKSTEDPTILGFRKKYEEEILATQKEAKQKEREAGLKGTATKKGIEQELIRQGMSKEEAKKQAAIIQQDPTNFLKDLGFRETPQETALEKYFIKEGTTDPTILAGQVKLAQQNPREFYESLGYKGKELDEQVRLYNQTPEGFIPLSQARQQITSAKDDPFYKRWLPEINLIKLGYDPQKDVAKEVFRKKAIDLGLDKLDKNMSIAPEKTQVGLFTAAGISERRGFTIGGAAGEIGAELLGESAGRATQKALGVGSKAAAVQASIGSKGLKGIFSKQGGELFKLGFKTIAPAGALEGMAAVQAEALANQEKVTAKNLLIGASIGTVAAGTLGGTATAVAPFSRVGRGTVSATARILDPPEIVGDIAKDIQEGFTSSFGKSIKASSVAVTVPTSPIALTQSAQITPINIEGAKVGTAITTPASIPTTISTPVRTDPIIKTTETSINNIVGTPTVTPVPTGVTTPVPVDTTTPATDPAIVPQLIPNLVPANVPNIVPVGVPSAAGRLVPSLLPPPLPSGLIPSIGGAGFGKGKQPRFVNELAAASIFAGIIGDASPSQINNRFNKEILGKKPKKKKQKKKAKKKRSKPRSNLDTVFKLAFGV